MSNSKKHYERLLRRNQRVLESLVKKAGANLDTRYDNRIRELIAQKFDIHKSRDMPIRQRRRHLRDQRTVRTAIMLSMKPGDGELIEAETAEIRSRIGRLWLKHPLLFLNMLRVSAPAADPPSDLHVATSRGDISAIEKFLAQGVSVNSCDQHQRVPLNIALTTRSLGIGVARVAVIKKLLEYAPDLEIVDTSGRTPLLIAATGGLEGSVSLLLEHGSSIRALGVGPMYGGMSALVCATMGDFDNEDAVQSFLVLLRAEASLSEGLPQDSALQRMVWRWRFAHERESCTQCVSALMRFGKDPNYVIPGGAHFSGKSAFHVAAQVGAAPLLEMMLPQITDINLSSSDGYTPLHFAAMSGELAAVQLLLDSGADVHAVDDSGHDALWHAIRSGPCIMLLHDLGLDVNQAGKDNRTPLMHAAGSGSYEGVQTLLDLGADPNPLDEHGRLAWIYIADRSSDAGKIGAALQQAGSERFMG